MKLAKEDLDLMKKVKEFAQSKNEIAFSTVFCLIKTKSGKIFAGVNLECRSRPISSCAEYGAISSMFSSGYGQIQTIVTYRKGEFISPWGKCRELIYEISKADLKIEILLKNFKVNLGELLPFPWQEIYKK